MTSTLFRDVAAPLLNVDDVVPYNEGDFAVMAEVKAVLAKHNAQSRFGIMLLHDHFPVADDEVMVEFEDAQNRTLTTKPVKASQLVDMPVTLMETQWRLDTSDTLDQPTRRCIKHQGGRHEVDPDTVLSTLAEPVSHCVKRNDGRHQIVD